MILMIRWELQIGGMDSGKMQKGEKSMKIQEFRDILKRADRDKIEKAFAESYKCFSKAKKEEIDDMILGILAGEETKGKSRSKEAVSFEKLENEIELFLENAYEQNYLVPNRIVPKNQRPKWRFQVKNYLKALQSIGVEDANYERATELYMKLYKMLCYACSYYLFSTEDAFRSVGFPQYELFETLVIQTMKSGYDREKTVNLLKLATTGGLSRESLYEEQEMILVNHLKTTDMKEAMLEDIAELTEEKEASLQGLDKYNSKRFYIESEINELCNVYLMIKICMAECEDGLKFCYDHMCKPDSEIILCCTLSIIAFFDDKPMWVSAYQYGLQKKITPREELKSKYTELTKQINKEE